MTALPGARAALILGSLGSSLDGGGSISADEGTGAQEIQITDGTWQITSLRLNLGNRSGNVSPVVQVRDATGSGGLPGTTLGSFALNASDIPTGPGNFAVLVATPQSSLSLTPGNYWLYLGNTAAGTAYDIGLTMNLVQEGTHGIVMVGSSSDGIAVSADGGNSFMFDPGTIGQAAHVELNGDLLPVPEPGQVAASLVTLLGVGGFALRHHLRRKRAE